MDKDALKSKLAQYSFYQTVDLGDGIKTPGLPIAAKQQKVLDLISSMDLRGKSVIDLGCANGLFALAAEQRGAEPVLAVDHTKHNIECLETVILPHLESKIRPLHLNALDLSSDAHGKFDLVIFAGVLYHLKYPFSALKVVRDLAKNGGSLILETCIFDDFNSRASLYCPSPSDTPYKGRGANSCAFFNEKALHENLQYFGFKVIESAIMTNPLRRFAKKLVGKAFSSYYPNSNIVLRCERDPSIENENLTAFYEATPGG
ncbi:MAG TPA: class I SAM-dependent methyltransferase [Gammaproteobacteria bacterium]|nr:class I SAM-dependent methyltransferase [Gammaproteobacteria bacterium]